MASEQSPSSPRLCFNCSVFYGCSATGGLCSGCYLESIKQEVANGPEPSLAQLTAPANFFDAVIRSISLESDTTTAAEDSVVAYAAASSVSASSGDGLDLSAPGRCASCNKKLGMLRGFLCKCGNSYCTTHRYAEQHECGFDYKAAGRALLEKRNPVIKSEKLQKL